MPATTRGAPQRAARPELVYRKLRELIVRGQLAPGTRIVETDVAQRLGVSRTPVRGALQRLQQEGYILDSPSLQQSRPTVAPLTREDARELFSIVAEIEGRRRTREGVSLEAGLGKDTIGSWARGQRTPNIGNLRAALQTMGLAIDCTPLDCMPRDGAPRHSTSRDSTAGPESSLSGISCESEETLQK